jgi:pyruvate kinase
MNRRTKIVATIGPASRDESMMEKLLNAGVDVARLNFSHGTQEEHASAYSHLRRVAQRLERPLSILQDLPGPKIRVGEIENGSVELIPGEHISLTSSPVIGNKQLLSLNLPELAANVKPGVHILLDDGNLELVVDDVTGDEVKTTVLIGGPLKSHKGAHIPGAHLNISAFTEKDRHDLAFGLKMGVDAVALSFVRTAQDITQVRQFVREQAPKRRRIPLIAKLEHPESLANLDEILKVADGVMVARGDMGIELSPEAVPVAQKRIIQSANRRARLVITATQMLDSMIHNPRPTRAEASDVANAIFDGSDAVMLSGETAAGDHPLQAVEMMNAIILQAEKHLMDWGRWSGLLEPEDDCDDAYFVTKAAGYLARDRNVAAIAVFTRSGRTARLLSKMRPQVQILAFTPDPETYHRLGLFWGVRPYLVPNSDTVEAMLSAVEKAMLASQAVKPGQQVVLVCGYPVKSSPGANLALLHTLGG